MLRDLELSGLGVHRGDTYCGQGGHQGVIDEEMFKLDIKAGLKDSLDLRKGIKFDL